MLPFPRIVCCLCEHGLWDCCVLKPAVHQYDFIRLREGSWRAYDREVSIYRTLNNNLTKNTSSQKKQNSIFRLELKITIVPFISGMAVLYAVFAEHSPHNYVDTLWSHWNDAIYMSASLTGVVTFEFVLPSLLKNSNNWLCL